MNLTWLEDFLALAESGNFSRAASMRNMTQPAFSRRIRALEEWLGVALFDRATHPVTLTETGQWFQEVAKETLLRITRIREEARAVSDAASSMLRFASTHALSFTFLPVWLRGLESSSSVGPIQLASDVMNQCETLMLQDRVHFLLCHWHPKVPNRLTDENFKSVQVGQDVLIAVSKPDRTGRPLHLLSAKSAKTPAILAYSAESGLGRIVRATKNAYFQEPLEPVFSAHLASVLKPMTLDGRGVAWLPKSMVEEELADGRLVEAGDKKENIKVEIRLFRKRVALSRQAEGFWEKAAR